MIIPQRFLDGLVVPVPELGNLWVKIRPLNRYDFELRVDNEAGDESVMEVSGLVLAMERDVRSLLVNIAGDAARKMRRHAVWRAECCEFDRFYWKYPWSRA